MPFIVSWKSISIFFCLRVKLGVLKFIKKCLVICYYTILYDTIRYYTILYDTIRYYTILYDTILTIYLVPSNNNDYLNNTVLFSYGPTLLLF